MAIYGIEGTFGKGKTTTAVYIMKRNAKKNVKIFTNIKVNTQKLPHVTVIGDDEIVDTMETIYELNKKDREMYTKYEQTEDLPAVYDRKKFTKFIMILDECGVILDSSLYKDKSQTDITVRRFLDQNRKLNTDVYLVLPRMERLLMLWRRYAFFWLDIKRIPIIDCNMVYAYERNEEGGYVEDVKIGKDSSGNNVTIRTIRKHFLFWYWIPPLWGRYYDDWFLTGYGEKND